VCYCLEDRGVQDVSKRSVWGDDWGGEYFWCNNLDGVILDLVGVVDEGGGNALDWGLWDDGSCGFHVLDQWVNMGGDGPLNVLDQDRGWLLIIILIIIIISLSNMTDVSVLGWDNVEIFDIFIYIFLINIFIIELVESCVVGIGEVQVIIISRSLRDDVVDLVVDGWLDLCCDWAVLNLCYRCHLRSGVYKGFAVGIIILVIIFIMVDFVDGWDLLVYNWDLLCLDEWELVCLDNWELVCVGDWDLVCLDSWDLVCLDSWDLVCLDLVCLDEWDLVCLDDWVFVCLDDGHLMEVFVSIS